MPLRLRVIPPSSRQNDAAGAPVERTVDFDDGVGQIRIGRRPDLELSLPYAPLSGVHARLVRASDSAAKTDHWLLEDLGSTNGTFVGGERLKPGVKHPVIAGMQIKLAEISLIFEGALRSKDDAGVQAEAVNKGSAKTVIAEPPGKSTGPVQTVQAVPSEGSNKVTGKTGSDVSAKGSGSVPGGGQVQGGGHVQREASNKVTSKTVSEVSSGKSASKSPINEPTATYVRRQFTDVFAAGPSVAQVPYLSAVGGIDGAVTSFRLEHRDHEYMFGRTRRCEFRVDVQEVSREHASFSRRADGIYVKDLGSVNGVLVNNTRVKEYRLYDGDLIQIGHVKLRLFDPTEPGRREAERHTGTSPLSRSTPSRSVASHSAPPHSAPSPGAPHDAHAHVEPPSRAYEPPPAHSEAPAALRSELHPAIAGQLAAEGGGYRQRRPSVRVRIQESWESSSGFRYTIVIVAASVLAVCAVIIGFRLAG
jgi:pSer/pThr/pTyr-binding forkhead associated (FHA) protein